MLPRPIHALAVLSAAIVPATAADVVTFQLGGVDGPTAGVGQVIGSSGSLTSYVIEGVPATIVAGASAYYQSYVYPDGDVMSQGCSIIAPSSVECEVYMSDKDSGSTMVSSLPASMLSDVGDYVVTITGTKTEVRPETTVNTITDSSFTSPTSTTAKPTEAGTASKITGDASAGAAVETTSSGASTQLAMDKSWIGGLLAVMLAAF